METNYVQIYRFARGAGGGHMDTQQESTKPQLHHMAGLKTTSSTFYFYIYINRTNK